MTPYTPTGQKFTGQADEQTPDQLGDRITVDLVRDAERERIHFFAPELGGDARLSASENCCFHRGDLK